MPHYNTLKSAPIHALGRIQAVRDKLRNRRKWAAVMISQWEYFLPRKLLPGVGGIVDQRVDDSVKRLVGSTSGGQSQFVRF